MIDPIRLQALIDGECSAAERRQLLQQIDSQPDQWRDIALALLEEQVFAKDIRTLRGKAIQNSTAEMPVATHSVFLDQEISKRPVARKGWRFGPVLAACLALSVGLTIGRFVLRGDGDSLLGNSNGNPMLVDNATEKSGAKAQAEFNQDEYERSLPVADLRSSNNRYEIPIYDVNHVDPTLVLAKRAYEVERAKEQLRRQGYDIDLQQNYLTGQLNDGRKVIVPIQEVGLRPYGQ
ncbi:hypothetical protein SH449x_003850 [Pirellulaceae bacterium SH449]